MKNTKEKYFFKKNTEQIVFLLANLSKLNGAYNVRTTFLSLSMSPSNAYLPLWSYLLSTQHGSNTNRALCAVFSLLSVPFVHWLVKPSSPSRV